MVKVNVKAEKSRGENKALDGERELPAGENGSETAEFPVVERSGFAEENSNPDGELQKLRAERDTLIDRLARSQAEFENARRRATREQQEFRDYAVQDAVRTLLPVMDSFERAIQVKSEAAEFRSGVELIYKQLEDALAKLGVRAIPAKGEPFDPHYHEAIEMVETSEAPDHEVLEELQRGYKLKDRLLRPAMVKVAKNPGN